MIQVAAPVTIGLPGQHYCEGCAGVFRISASIRRSRPTVGTAVHGEVDHAFVWTWQDFSRNHRCTTYRTSLRHDMEHVDDAWEGVSFRHIIQTPRRLRSDVRFVYFMTYDG